MIPYPFTTLIAPCHQPPETVVTWHAYPSHDHNQQYHRRQNAGNWKTGVWSYCKRTANLSRLFRRRIHRYLYSLLQSEIKPLWVHCHSKCPPRRLEGGHRLTRCTHM